MYMIFGSGFEKNGAKQEIIWHQHGRSGSCVQLSISRYMAAIFNQCLRIWLDHSFCYILSTTEYPAWEGVHADDHIRYRSLNPVIRLICSGKNGIDSFWKGMIVCNLCCIRTNSLCRPSLYYTILLYRWRWQSKSETKATKDWSIWIRNLPGSMIMTGDLNSDV